MFSTPSKKVITILAAFNLSSANAFNLVSSKILSFGKELKTQSYSKIFFMKSRKQLYRQFKDNKFCNSIAPYLFTTRVVKTLKVAFNSSFDPFPIKSWSLHGYSRSLLKTLWEKEKLLITSNFSFSQCFSQFGEFFAILIKFEVVLFKVFQFGKGYPSKKALWGKGKHFSNNCLKSLNSFSRSLKLSFHTFQADKF